MPNPSPQSCGDALFVLLESQTSHLLAASYNSLELQPLKINLTLCFSTLMICTECTLLKILLALIFGTAPSPAGKHQLQCPQLRPSQEYSQPSTHPTPPYSARSNFEIWVVSSKSPILPPENLN